MLLNEWKSKCQRLEEELDDLRRDDTRWKERYVIMEKQKNERIKLLEGEMSLVSSQSQYIPKEKKPSRVTFGANTELEFSQQSSTEYYDL